MIAYCGRPTAAYFCDRFPYIGPSYARETIAESCSLRVALATAIMSQTGSWPARYHGGMLDLDEIFGPGGPLQRALPDFKSRGQQLRMARRVATALEHRETLVVEAGTGTGKTFAYLVPALLSGARVLISTGTRTLQDQLFSKDLPLVAAALGRPARIALLKGRANYLCLYRLVQAGLGGEQLSFDNTAQPTTHGSMLARIERWARTTRSGDLSEVRGLSDSHPVWQQVTSTRDNCLGNRCPDLSRCHVALARREALEADIVIVNHHLLLADLALKEDGFGDILGAADAVILDEAHQIPDLATQFFGANVSSRRIDNLLKEMQREAVAYLTHVPENSEAAAAVSAALEVSHMVEAGVRTVFATLPSGPGRLPWTEQNSELNASVDELTQALQRLQEKLAVFDAESPLAQIGARTGELALNLERIAEVDELEGVRSV